MPRNAVGAFIGAAVIIFVMAFAVGALDTDANETRFTPGACDIPEQNRDSAVSLTTSHAIGTDLYDSWQVPFGTFYQVPANSELRICQLLVNNAPAVTHALLHLAVGYGDTAASATSTVPLNAVEIAHLPATEASSNGVYEFNTLLGVIPAGKYPFVTYSPKADWEAFAVGVVSQVRE